MHERHANGSKPLECNLALPSSGLREAQVRSLVQSQPQGPGVLQLAVAKRAAEALSEHVRSVVLSALLSWCHWMSLSDVPQIRWESEDAAGKWQRLFVLFLPFGCCFFVPGFWFAESQGRLGWHLHLEGPTLRPNGNGRSKREKPRAKGKTEGPGRI